MSLKFGGVPVKELPITAGKTSLHTVHNLLQYVTSPQMNFQAHVLKVTVLVIIRPRKILAN